MKPHYLAISITLFIVCFGLSFFSRAQQADSTLQTNRERWKVKKNEGMFGLAKPDFGPYTTIDVGKLNVPVHKTKIKDPEGASISISGSEGIDFTKLRTIEKQKQFKLLLGSGTDTTKAVFAIASVSKERKQTFLAKMLSKNEESGTVVLSYDRDVLGTIQIGTDTSAWEFFIDDFTSGSRRTEQQWPNASIATVYLKHGKDSFYTKFQSLRSPDVLLYSSDTAQLATLEFTGATPYIWIRRDTEPMYQRAVATLFAVIIAIKDL